MIIVLLAIAALSMIRPFSPARYFPIPMEQKPDSLAIYYKMLDLEAEGSYDSFMTGRKHAAGRLAPAVLRQFIERFEPQRISFTQGVSNKDGQISFWWYMNEFAVKGNAAEFTVAAETFLKELDFAATIEQDAGQGLNTWVKTDGPFQYKFVIENIENYTGGPLCGGSISLEVIINSILPEPFIGGMVKLYPAINCYLLPSKIADVIKKRFFSGISYGGTWENYYTWDADIKCLDEPESAMLNKSITEIILDAGYRFHEENNETRTFIYQETGSPSFFYLTKDETNILNIRFQPGY